MSRGIAAGLQGGRTGVFTGLLTVVEDSRGQTRLLFRTILSEPGPRGGLTRRKDRRVHGFAHSCGGFPGVRHASFSGQS